MKMMVSYKENLNYYKPLKKFNKYKIKIIYKAKIRMSKILLMIINFY